MPFVQSQPLSMPFGTTTVHQRIIVPLFDFKTNDANPVFDFIALLVKSIVCHGSNSLPHAMSIDFLVNERQLFLGMLGEELLELRDGDISKKVRLGTKLKEKGLQDRLKDVFKETEKRKAGLVLTRDEREKLWKKAGASRAELAQSSSTDQFSKFDDWFFLKTGACHGQSILPSLTLSCVLRHVLLTDACC